MMPKVFLLILYIHEKTSKNQIIKFLGVFLKCNLYRIQTIRDLMLFMFPLGCFETKIFQSFLINPTIKPIII